MVSMSYVHSPVAHTFTVKLNMFNLMSSARTVSAVREYIISEIGDMQADLVASFAALIWGDIESGEHNFPGSPRVTVVRGEYVVTISIWKNKT